MTLFGGDITDVLRQLNEDNLDSLCQVLVKQKEQREGGGSRSEYVSQGDPIPCRVGQVSGTSGLRSDQQAPVNRFAVVFAAGTELPLEARLRVTGEKGDGEDFDILLTIEGSSGNHSNEVLRKYTCVLVPPNVAT